MIVNLFGGPGGMDQGARIAGVTEPIYGYDIDRDACATAEAAGFRRTQASVTDLDPDDFAGATGAIITPPCPPFSQAGLGGGRKDYPKISQALTLLGDYFGGSAPEEHVADAEGEDYVEFMTEQAEAEEVCKAAAEQSARNVAAQFRTGDLG